MSPAFFWRIGRTDARWTQLETSMPRGRKGEKRIADVIGATVMVARIVTGEGAPRPKNFVRTHKAHKLSLAMAAGLTDKLWDMAAKPPKCHSACTRTCSAMPAVSS